MPDASDIPMRDPTLLDRGRGFNWCVLGQHALTAGSLIEVISLVPHLTARDLGHYACATHARTRTIFVDPAFDCRGGKCQHVHKGDHGIKAEEWFFIVKSEEEAICLEITSGLMLPSARLEWTLKYYRDYEFPKANAVALHATWTVDEAAFAEQAYSKKHCDFLDGRPCYTTAQISAGRDLYRAAGNLDRATAAWYNQPESLWDKLEAELKSRVELEKPRRVDKHKMLCPTCKGTRLVDLHG